jgi:hypothetical protein
MIQRTRSACFLLEPVQSIHIFKEAGRKYFHSDVTPQLSVTRSIDFAHAACANSRMNFVAT